MWNKTMIDFLGIGAQKAGTSWLMANLSKHPSVWTPPFIKEIHYFDKIHLGYKRNMLGAIEARSKSILRKKPKLSGYFSKVLDKDFAFTDKWYKFIFSEAPRRKVKGECTPLYFALPAEGVEHVHRLAPDIKIICMIRDPLARYLSSLKMVMDHRGCNESSKVSSLLSDPLFIGRGSYAENIARWEARFDRSQFLYIPFGDVRSEPLEVMRRVESHLGLRSFDDYPRLGDKVNKASENEKIIDEFTIAQLNKLAAPQMEYLLSRFGSDFCDRIR